MSKYLIAIFIFVSSCTSCGKGETQVNNAGPSNLTLSVTVSNDNSGKVSFNATATNAVTYDFDFGNGVFQTVPSGIVTYRYPVSGNYTVNVIAKGSGGQTISKSAQVTVSVTMSLLWSDEFETAGAPNPAKWGYDIGTGSGGWGNNELEYYTNRIENAVVENGVLKIKAVKENYNGSQYTSARLLTKNKFSVKYGKIEASAKLPEGVGTWPAIWMLGNNIDAAGWPGCGEIDIMEHKGSDLNKIFGTVHHPGHSGSNGDGGTTIISNASTQFHKYTVEWSPSFIKFSVDNQLFYNFTNSGSLPFNQDFFIIMNLAMGGTFAGPVDPSLTNATMEIDYIRVYQ